MEMRQHQSRHDQVDRRVVALRRLLISLGGLVAMWLLGLLLAGNANAQSNPDASPGSPGSLSGVVVGPIEQITEPVTQVLVPVVAPVTRSITSAVAPVTHTVGALAKPVVAAVTPVVSAVTAPVAHAVAAPQSRSMPGLAAPQTHAPQIATAPATPPLPVVHRVAVDHVRPVVAMHIADAVSAVPAGRPGIPWPPTDAAFGGAMGTATASSGGTSGAAPAVPDSQVIPGDASTSWRVAADSAGPRQRWRPHDRNHPS